MNITAVRRAARIASGIGQVTYQGMLDLRSYVAAAILGAFGMIVLMWVLNLFSHSFTNFILIMVALCSMIATIITILHPKFIFWAAGIGSAIEGLDDRDITQGAVKGIGIYFRAASGALFYFSGCATVLAIIPFGNAPLVFWKYALIIATVTAMFTWLNISTRKWLQIIVVTGAIVLSIILLLQLVLPQGVTKLIGSQYMAIDRAAERQAAKVDFCSLNETDPSCQPEPIFDPNSIDTSELEVPAGSSGAVIAPINNRWSEWRMVDKVVLNGKFCGRIWTAEPGRDDVMLRYKDEYGQAWKWDGRDFTADIAGFSAQSRIGVPVRVDYQIWPRTGKTCKTKA